MGFFWQWLWYLLAFVAGSASPGSPWLTVHRTSEAEAIADLRPGSREIGVR